MTEKEAKLQIALGTFKTQPFLVRIKWFERHAISLVKRVIPPMTTKELLKLKQIDIDKLLIAADKEVGKVVELFNTIAQEGEGFYIGYDIYDHEDTATLGMEYSTNISTSTYVRYDKKCDQVLEHIMDAIGLDVLILEHLVCSSDKVCNWISNEEYD